MIQGPRQRSSRRVGRFDPGLQALPIRFGQPGGYGFSLAILEVGLLDCPQSTRGTTPPGLGEHI